MKCLYAIPPDAIADAYTLCTTYATALKTLSVDAIQHDENVRAFSESSGVAALKLDDDDWLAVRARLEEQGESVLAGEIFWPGDAAERVRTALSKEAPSTAMAGRAVAAWLANQVRRERAIVLLAC